MAGGVLRSRNRVIVGPSVSIPFYADLPRSSTVKTRDRHVDGRAHPPLFIPSGYGG